MESLQDLTSKVKPISVSPDATQVQFFKSADKTRLDVNIGKWAGWIFSSPRAKDLDKPKSYTWQYELNGETLTAGIEVTPLIGKTRPTTTTYKIYQAVIQIWDEQGRPPDGIVTFSYRLLASKIKRKWSGQNTISFLQNHLNILSGTEISWLRSFKSKEGVKTLLEDMNMIEGKSLLKHEFFSKKERTTAQQTVRLNPDTVRNMINGVTKPCNFKVLLSIKNDSSANLYNILDTFLSKKERWERKSLPLLREELCYGGTRYDNKALRLEQLQKFKRDLDGKRLSSGTLFLYIALTSDGSDYKLIAIKVPDKPRRFGAGSPANSKEDVPHIREIVIDGLDQIRPGRSGINIGVLDVVCRWYPKRMLFDVLSVLKADYRDKIKKSPIRAYMNLLHIEAHKRGMEWINTCGLACKYRPKNKSNTTETKQLA